MTEPSDFCKGLPSDMDYEVELKFCRTSQDDLHARVGEFGAVLSAPVEQRDTYYAHPARDFVQTDEAFRLRTQDESNWLTYKGPKIDRETKTRQEVEIAVESGADARQRAAALLAGLGFREVGTVFKHRRSCGLEWEGLPVKLVLDHVESLGEFVEIETIACAADWPAARDALHRLAAHLGLSAPERRSYLELVLEQRRRENGG
ncbi:MAG: class IV adenylate cyclase [Planctomycetaceae bacterium]|nr:class IV adenylate cyclase [Planctomycetaceae bacterium]